MENTPFDAIERSSTDSDPVVESQDNLYHSDRFDPRDSVGNLIRLALSSLQSQIDREMGPYDLTAMQWQPLYIIAMGRANTAADLSREMQVDTGATTRMIDRLETKGLLTRERSTHDRRLVKLVLTDSGRRSAQEVPRVLCHALNAHLQDFDRQELESLKKMLSRLISNGQAQRAEVTPA